MKMGVLFDQKEEEERYQLRLFLETYFKTTTKYNQFEDKLTARKILNIYQKENPDTVLSEAQVLMQLYFGGFFTNEKFYYQTQIKVDMFNSLKVETQQEILYLMDTTYHYQYITKLKFPISSVDSQIEKGLYNFIYLFIYDCKNFRYAGTLKNAEKKISIQELYTLYIQYCIQEEYIVLPKKALIKAIQSVFKIKPKNSYWKKKSGISLFENLLAPYIEEDIKLSLFYGVGIMTINNKLIFNDGILLENLKQMDTLEKYLEQRKNAKKVYYEQREAQEEEKKKLESIINRREIEILE